MISSTLRLSVASGSSFSGRLLSFSGWLLLASLGRLLLIGGRLLGILCRLLSIVISLFGLGFRLLVLLFRLLLAVLLSLLLARRGWLLLALRLWLRLFLCLRLWLVLRLRLLRFFGWFLCFSFCGLRILSRLRVLGRLGFFFGLVVGRLGLCSRFGLLCGFGFGRLLGFLLLRFFLLWSLLLLRGFLRLGWHLGRLFLGLWLFLGRLCLRLWLLLRLSGGIRGWLLFLLSIVDLLRLLLIDRFLVLGLDGPCIFSIVSLLSIGSLCLRLRLLFGWFLRLRLLNLLRLGRLWLLSWLLRLLGGLLGGLLRFGRSWVCRLLGCLSFCRSLGRCWCIGLDFLGWCLCSGLLCLRGCSLDWSSLSWFCLFGGGLGFLRWFFFGLGCWLRLLSLGGFLLGRRDRLLRCSFSLSSGCSALDGSWRLFFALSGVSSGRLGLCGSDLGLLLWLLLFSWLGLGLRSGRRLSLGSFRIRCLLFRCLRLSSRFLLHLRGCWLCSRGLLFLLLLGGGLLLGWRLFGRGSIRLGSFLGWFLGLVGLGSLWLLVGCWFGLFWRFCFRWSCPCGRFRLCWSLCGRFHFRWCPCRLWLARFLCGYRLFRFRLTGLCGRLLCLWFVLLDLGCIATSSGTVLRWSHFLLLWCFSFFWGLFFFGRLFLGRLFFLGGFLLRSFFLWSFLSGFRLLLIIGRCLLSCSGLRLFCSFLWRLLLLWLYLGWHRLGRWLLFGSGRDLLGWL